MNAQQQVDYLLSHVPSVTEMRPEFITELRSVQAIGRFPITKFKLSRSEFLYWIMDNAIEIRGVEYDREEERIVIKPTRTCLHQIVVHALARDCFKVLEQKARECHHPDSLNIQSQSSSSLLSGPYADSWKVADTSLERIDHEYPIIAVEVGVVEPLDVLFDDTDRWLQGSNGSTQLVIIVDIQEAPTAANHSPWGLSDREFLALPDLDEQARNIPDVAQAERYSHHGHLHRADVLLHPGQSSPRPSLLGVPLLRHPAAYTRKPNSTGSRILGFDCDSRWATCVSARLTSNYR